MLGSGLSEITVSWATSAAAHKRLVEVSDRLGMGFLTLFKFDMYVVRVTELHARMLRSQSPDGNMTYMHCNQADRN